MSNKLMIIILFFTIIIYCFNKKIEKMTDTENETKKNIYKWFQKDAAQEEDLPLNQLSGWGTSDKIFNDVIKGWMYKLRPRIKSGDTVFKMGAT